MELYINRPNTVDNERLFDELLSHKEEIEASFGGPLTWQRLDGKHACRIAYDITIGGYRDDEAKWTAIHAALIDAMVRLEKALSPFLANFTRTR